MNIVSCGGSGLQMLQTSIPDVELCVGAGVRASCGFANSKSGDGAEKVTLLSGELQFRPMFGFE